MPKSTGGYRDPIPLNRLLDENGDGTGNEDAADNYSITPATFFIQPPDGEVFVIDELSFHITSGTVMGADKYGDLAALTNGIQVNVTMKNMNGTSLLPNGGMLKRNDQFLFWGPTALRIVNFTGGKDSLIASYRADSFKQELILDGAQEHKIEIILNDNFTSLLSHHFIAHGHF